MNLCEEDWNDNIRQPRQSSRGSQVPHHYVFDDHRRPSKYEKNHKSDSYFLTQAGDGVTVDSLTLAKEQFEAKLKLQQTGSHKLHASSFDSPKKTIAPKLRVSPRASPRSNNNKIDEFLPASPAPMSSMPLVADPAEPSGAEMLLTRSPTRGRRVHRTRSGPRQLPPRRPSHGSAGSGDTPTSVATPPISSPRGTRSTRSGLSKRMNSTKVPSSPSSFDDSFSDSFFSREYGEAFAKPVLAQVDHLLLFDQPFGSASDGGASEVTPTFSPRPALKRGSVSHKNLSRARRERSKSRERTRPLVRASQQQQPPPPPVVVEEIRWDRRLPTVDVPRPPTPPKAKNKLLTSKSKKTPKRMHQSWPDSSKRQGHDIFGDDIDQLNAFDDSFSDIITWRRF